MGLIEKEKKEIEFISTNGEWTEHSELKTLYIRTKNQKYR